MTHPREPDPLRPMLQTAESELLDRLEEACGHDVKSESTAELMRLEESLTEAALAAKQAVSLRRRLRTGHGTAQSTDPAVGAQRPAADVAKHAADRRATQPDDHQSALADEESAVRELLDQHGQSWRIWAVNQEQLHPERLVANQMGDYREGWLVFENTNGIERRRLPHFPPNWRRLTNLDLEGLLERAECVRSRRGTRDDADTTSA